MGMLFLSRCYPYMTSLDRHQLPSLSERQQERQAPTFGGSSAPGHLAEGRLFLLYTTDNGGLNSCFLESLSLCLYKEPEHFIHFKQIPSNRSPGRGTCPLWSPLSLGLFLKHKCLKILVSNRISDPEQGNFQHQLEILTVKPGALEKGQYAESLESFTHNKISRPQVSNAQVPYSLALCFWIFLPNKQSLPMAFLESLLSWNHPLQQQVPVA